jgi:hypothetical protein
MILTGPATRTRTPPPPPLLPPNTRGVATINVSLKAGPNGNSPPLARLPAERIQSGLNCYERDRRKLVVVDQQALDALYGNAEVRSKPSPPPHS